MTDLDRSIRVRALLDAWLPLVVLVFVVLAALSGFWVQQVYVQQDVEQQQRTVAQWSESTSYDHSAVITNESIAFNRSERVENRPVYYTSLVDDIDVTYRYEYTATGANGTVRVDTDTFIQYRGVEGETVLWSFTEPLASETAEGLEPGENQTVEVGVDVGSVLETIAEVEAQLGAAGTTEISVVSVSTVDGEVAGESLNATYESTMPVTVTPETFRVLEIQTVDEQGGVTETVEVVSEPSVTERVGSGLALLLSLVGVVGLVGARYAGVIELTEDEAQLLETYQQEQEFDEWITPGTFPSEQDYEATILVDDLEGLVDVAIDTNKRVIKDEQLGVSTVLDGEYAYVYVRPDSPANDWIVNYADMTMDEFDGSQF